MQNSFTSRYVLRYTSVNDPSIEVLKVKHAVTLHDCAKIAVDEDGVICVA